MSKSPKKKRSSPDFETTLAQLEQVVTRLEAGNLPLDEALDEFEKGVKLAREGQKALQEAEQRIQILLNNDKDAALHPFSVDAE